MFDIRIPELMKLIQAVSEEEALDRTLARQLSTIRDLIHFQKGYFLGFDGEQLRVKAECHLESDLQTELCTIPFEEFQDLSHTFVNWVVRTRKPLLLEHPADDPRFSTDPYFGSTQVKVVLGLPLLSNQQWVGLFYFQNGPAGGTFPPDQMQLLGALSGPMALAIEKATRMSSLSARCKTLQAELHQIRQNQSAVSLKEALVFSDSLARSKARFASNLLHKIGNELNSLGLIRELVQEQFEESQIEHLFKAIQLLGDHRDELAAYLTEDPKGKLLPRYFLELDATLRQERQGLDEDLKKMRDQVECLKELLSQFRGRTKLEAELNALDLVRLTEEILNLECKRLPNGTVHIEKDFSRSMLLVRVPRSNLVFILKYLIKKTIEAIEPLSPERRSLIWSMEEEGSEWVRLHISGSQKGSQRRPLSQVIARGTGNKDNAFFAGLRDSIAEMEALGCQFEITNHGNPGFTVLLPRAEEP